MMKLTMLTEVSAVPEEAQQVHRLPVSCQCEIVRGPSAAIDWLTPAM